jgi:ABC-type transporter Mla MlaB component
MVRIMTATKPNTTTVTLDGEVAGEYVEAIDTCVQQAIGKGRPVHLFLRDVSKIDEAGQALLERLAANGVHLSAHGVYIAYIVAEISRSAALGKRRIGFRNAVAEIPAPRRDGDRNVPERSEHRILKCG